MRLNINFMPSIQCPHCGKHQHCDVSGWGRTGLNTRYKSCKHCNKEFFVNVYVETSLDAVGQEKINSIKSSICITKKMMCEKLERLTRELEAARRAYHGVDN